MNNQTWNLVINNIKISYPLANHKLIQNYVIPSNDNSTHLNIEAIESSFYSDCKFFLREILKPIYNINDKEYIFYTVMHAVRKCKDGDYKLNIKSLMTNFVQDYNLFFREMFTNLNVMKLLDFSPRSYFWIVTDDITWNLIFKNYKKNINREFVGFYIESFCTNIDNRYDNDTLNKDYYLYKAFCLYKELSNSKPNKIKINNLIEDLLR